VKALLSYGLALVGLGMVVLSLLKALRGNLSYPSARLLVTNLLRTNPNQAEATCQSMPGTFYEPLAATMKACAMMGTRDLSVITQASRPTYDAVGQAVVQGFKAHITKAKIGLMMAVGALALSLAMAGKPDKPPPDDPNYDPTADVVEAPEPGFFDGPGPLVILALLAAGGILWIFLRKQELERSVVRARAELLPEVERAFAEGRYRLPAPPR